MNENRIVNLVALLGLGLVIFLFATESSAVIPPIARYRRKAIDRALRDRLSRRRGSGWTYAAAQPDGTRAIPIIEAQRTHIVPEAEGHRVHERTEWLALFVSRYVAYQRAAGNADVDWRSLMMLYVWETGWDRNCWGCNTGNRHGKPAWDGISDVVWTTDTRAVGAMIINDDHSPTFLYAYANFADGFAAEHDWFQHGAWSEVWEALQIPSHTLDDGLETCKDFWLSLAVLGYSTTAQNLYHQRGPDPVTAQAVDYWRFMVTHVGEHAFQFATNGPAD